MDNQSTDKQVTGMSRELIDLIERARETHMTPEERETQRLNFTYGNTHFENERITRDTVRRASEEMKKQGQPDGDAR